jgi:hypothetical protein
MGQGVFARKRILTAVVGAALAIAPALYAQDVVTGVRDVSKDVAHGTKKAADKTADARSMLPELPRTAR